MEPNTNKLNQIQEDVRAAAEDILNENVDNVEQFFGLDEELPEINDEYVEQAAMSGRDDQVTQDKNIDFEDEFLAGNEQNEAGCVLGDMLEETLAGVDPAINTTSTVVQVEPEKETEVVDDAAIICEFLSDADTEDNSVVDAPISVKEETTVQAEQPEESDVSIEDLILPELSGNDDLDGTYDEAQMVEQVATIVGELTDPADVKQDNECDRIVLPVLDEIYETNAPVTEEVSKELSELNEFEVPDCINDQKGEPISVNDDGSSCFGDKETTDAIRNLFGDDIVNEEVVAVPEVTEAENEIAALIPAIETTSDNKKKSKGKKKRSAARSGNNYVFAPLETSAPREPGIDLGYDLEDMGLSNTVLASEFVKKSRFKLDDFQVDEDAIKASIPEYDEPKPKKKLFESKKKYAARVEEWETNKTEYEEDALAKAIKSAKRKAKMAALKEAAAAGDEEAIAELASIKAKRKKKKKLEAEKKKAAELRRKQLEEEDDEPGNWFVNSVALIILIGSVAIGSLFFMDFSSAGKGEAIFAAPELPTYGTDGQYAVHVYEHVIVGKYPFVFENIEDNDADLQYSLMYEGTEIYNTGWLEPGGAISWEADDLEGGKTYGCDVIISARDHETQRELNSINLAQLYFVNKELPQTTKVSDFKYNVTVNGYSASAVKDNKVEFRYDVLVSESPYHRLKDDDTIMVTLPEEIPFADKNGTKEVEVQQPILVDRGSKYVHLMGKATVDNVEGKRFDNVIQFDISHYAKNEDGVINMVEKEEK